MTTRPHEAERVRSVLLAGVRKAKRAKSLAATFAAAGVDPTEALQLVLACRAIHAIRHQPIDDDEPVISWSGGKYAAWSGMAATKLVGADTLIEVLTRLGAEVKP